jgi:hypothetical protein
VENGCRSSGSRCLLHWFQYPLLGEFLPALLTLITSLTNKALVFLISTIGGPSVMSESRRLFSGAFVGLFSVSGSPVKGRYYYQSKLSLIRRQKAFRWNPVLPFRDRKAIPFQCLLSSQLFSEISFSWRFCQARNNQPEGSIR